MKIEELRNMSEEDLSVKLASCKEELGKLHYLKTVGQADKPHRFKELRRTVARIQTLLTERAAGTPVPGETVPAGAGAPPKARPRRKKAAEKE